MGDFDTFSDTAYQLKAEGEKITLTFKKGVPTSNQGTIEWNIPTPVEGCSDANGVYSGMVILLSTTPLDAPNIPIDGVVYQADPTANTDLHTGDKIGGNALVVGAIYECDKKGRGETLTTTLVISDLQSDTPYYIGGYATDCQFRYHSDGIRAYSDEYGKADTPDHPSTQNISIGANNTNCITPTDGTGLVAGNQYSFDVIVDLTYPNKTNVKTSQININGIDAGTYQQLVDQINKQLKLVDNPPQSPIAPNTGALYWNATTNKLYEYDGTTHNELSVIVEATDPSIITAGEYWYNPLTAILKIRGSSPLTWLDVEYSNVSYDPTAPVDNAYWFDGTTARMWNGVSWCDQTTLTTTTDPDTSCPTPSAGMFWYDETLSILKRWSVYDQQWVSSAAVSWPEAPNQLSLGTYWFDLNTNKLFVLDIGSVWSDLSSSTFVQTVEPITPADQDLWFNPTTEDLHQYNSATQLWTLLNVLVWPGDPSDVSSCEVWWKTTDNTLYLWDKVNSEWDLVTNFTISLADPLLPQPLAINTIWYNPTTKVMNRYDGSSWVVIEEYIAKSSDPTLVVTGDVWHDLTTSTWKQWGIPTASQWNTFDPVDANIDPTTLPSGTYWYNTTANVLNVRNGISWIVAYYSVAPYTPSRGTLWFDTSNDELYEWSGTTWEVSQPFARAYFYNCGITFESAQRGSSTLLIIPSTTVTSDYPTRTIPYAQYLWDQVSPTSEVLWPKEGYDGQSGVPSYMELGVGDDGTPDERRKIMDDIRYQLGYPTVDVELTPVQLEIAVQKALEAFRKRSSSAYKRGFFFLDVKPYEQSYKLTNRRIGYHKIVDISGAFRFTAAFLSTVHGSGVYGQVVLQHLYNMGTYDLTSFHLVSQYVEQLEHLFATRLVYNWDETDRTLSFYQSFGVEERVLLDCSVERTEQDLMSDRFAKTWIKRYALAEAMVILAQVRGKYGSLPGAGGGISLNSSDLLATADAYKAELFEQLEDYVTQNPEDYGMGSTFIIG